MVSELVVWVFKFSVSILFFFSLSFLVEGFAYSVSLQPF